MEITTRQECFAVIESALFELLDELGQEADVIDPETLLYADLGITSIDAIHLMVLLEDQIGRPMNFQDLAVRDGRYIDDLSVNELLDFVATSLNLPPATAVAPPAGG